MAVTYSITGGADGAKFNIDASTGVLTFKTAPDFEQPGDADHNNIYQVEVGASDGVNLTKKMHDITVTDKPDSNKPPTFTSPAAFSVPENQTAVATIVATDPDGGGTTPPPVTGELPNASNTGVPAGTTLTTHNGDLTTTQDGQVISVKNVTGMILVNHANVKIQKCKAGHILAHDGSSRVNLLIEDSEIFGTPRWNSGVSVVDCTGFIMRRCNIHHVERGIWMESNDAVVENNYFHELNNNTGSHDPHIDGIQIPYAQNGRIINNNVDCAKNISASITQYNVVNLRVERNRFNGGSYTMYVEGSSTGCVYDRNDFTDCYYGWIAGASCEQQTYTQNKFGGGAPMDGYPAGAIPSSGGKQPDKVKEAAPDFKKDRNKKVWQRDPPKVK